MANASKVTIEFLGKDKSLGKTTKQAASDVDRLGDRMRHAAKVGALGLAAGAVVAGKALFDMAKGAIEDDAASKLLARTMKKTAGATDAQVASTEKWITAQGKALGVADDDLRPALGKLARATGDVDEAQRLAALGMDVAAERGLSLEAVSKALARGQQGQVAGLAKLGVATKDAAGETLSFDQITKNMSKTFGGAAAAKADTLEGKMARLKLTVSETGESIGYKLLPVATRFADYLNAKAIPAIEDFLTEMKSGTGTGGDVADALRTVNNAARTTASVVGKVVGAFAGLPGSSQKVLALAAAATLVARRFSLSAPSLENFDKAATLATAKTVALRGGALGAGVGLAALTSKAGGATSELGALTTVGAGVATGFAAGGPWGAAIGGGAGILSVFTSRSSAAAAAQRVFDQAGKAVALTINEQTGALTRNTRATAAKELADSGAFTAARKVGVSYRDVLSAALGNASATKRVDAATAAYLKTQSKNYDSTIKASRVASTLGNAVHGTSGAIADQRRKIEQVNEAMRKGKDKTVTYRVATPGIGGALTNLAALGRSIDRAIAKSHKAKIGANAKGTDNWRGGLTMVGEEGPELINLAKGAQVIPNHKLPTGGGGSKPHPLAGSGSGVATTAVINLVLDGSVIHRALLKVKRDGGVELGLA